jgi:hypothetical protein
MANLSRIRVRGWSETEPAVRLCPCGFVGVQSLGERKRLFARNKDRGSALAGLRGLLDYSGSGSSPDVLLLLPTLSYVRPKRSLWYNNDDSAEVFLALGRSQPGRVDLVTAAILSGDVRPAVLPDF